MLDRLFDSLDRILVWIRGAEFTPRGQLTPVDWVLGGTCALIAALASTYAATIVGNTLYTEGSFGIWFQGDNPRVVANLLDPTSNQYRATVHPIFPILTTPWVSLIPRLGLSPLQVAKAVMAGCGAASAALIFATLRSISLPRPASLLFTAIFVASAAFLHWYGVIELGPLNGLSICLALWALAYGPTRRAWWWVLVSVATFAMTISNWSAGLAATIARWPVRRAIKISVAALATVFMLSIIQRAIYPTASYFFSPMGLANEKAYVTAESSAWAPADNLRSSVVYAAVAPAPAIGGKLPDAFVTYQHRPPGTAGYLGLTAMAAWLVLLGCGTYGAIIHRPTRPIAFGLGLMIAGQVGLGLVYGDETFLYAASVMPMLAVLAALSWFTPVRWLAAALAALVVVAGAANNVTQLGSASHLAAELLAEGGNNKWSRYAAGRFILPVPATRSAR
jgi:hypothetical protein